MKNQELEKPIHDLASCLADLEQVISRAELDIRKGAIVTTIKTEDLNDENEA